MILILRGHIRNSFDDTRLCRFVERMIVVYPNLKIYIHTWNIIQNNLSWRHMNTDYTTVTEQMIRKYFNSVKRHIKKIIIDDDSRVQILGRTVGKVSKTNTPIKGWKNYWAGQCRMIEYISNETNTNQDEIIINTRLDLLNNSNNINVIYLFDFLKNIKINTKLTRNRFLEDKPVSGIDNFIIGNLHTQYKLITNFHYNLDNLLNLLPQVRQQEHLVFYLNKKIF